MRQHVALLVVLDALAAATALGLARVLNFGLDPARFHVRSFTVPYAVLALAIVPTWLAVLAIKGAYDVGPFGTAVGSRRVIRAAADFLALVAVAYFVLHLEELAREFLAAAVPLAVALTLALRWGAGRVLCARRRRGLAVRRALIVGSRENVGEIVRRLAVRRSTELEPLAACVPGPREPFVVDGHRVPVLGGADDVLTALEQAKADTLVLTGDLAHGRVRRLAWALEGTGVDVFVIPALAHQAMEFDVRPVSGLPLVYVDPGRRRDRRPAPPEVDHADTGEGHGGSWVDGEEAGERHGGTRVHDAGPVAGPALRARPMAPPPPPPFPASAPGTNGTFGANGTKGTTGANATNGTTGARSTNGSNGTNGTTGADGTNGTNGTNGTTGADGTNGTNGTTGADRTNGTTAATSPDGSNRTNGTNGTTGADGTNGTTGATSRDDSNGTNGTNGMHGPTRPDPARPTTRGRHRPVASRPAPDPGA